MAPLLPRRGSKSACGLMDGKQLPRNCLNFQCTFFCSKKLCISANNGWFSLGTAEYITTLEGQKTMSAYNAAICKLWARKCYTDFPIISNLRMKILPKALKGPLLCYRLVACFPLRSRNAYFGNHLNVCEGSH